MIWTAYLNAAIKFSFLRLEYDSVYIICACLPEGHNATSRQRDIATSRHCDIATLRHFDNATSRHCDTATLWWLICALSRCRRVALWEREITTLRHRDTATTRHHDTATSRQREMAQISHHKKFIVVRGVMELNVRQNLHFLYQRRYDLLNHGELYMNTWYNN